MQKRANEPRAAAGKRNKIGSELQLKTETNNRDVINLDSPAAGGGALKLFAAAGSDLFITSKPFECNEIISRYYMCVRARVRGE